ncbi:MAG TPA: MotA/TolQ/ExbB proton channel family protein, partial [Pirellulaceae bacterium]|nr:MotA/TolQ/ExbB proton channel family protein [Pirellulaceae bacterium]
MTVLPNVPLAWERLDFEQRFLFAGGRYTRVNLLFTGLGGLVATIAFYTLLILAARFDVPVLSRICESFTERDFIPYPTAFLSFWSLCILFVKWRKLKLQCRALDYCVVPTDYDFVLSPATVERVTDTIHSVVDNPRHFVLF